MGQNINKQFFSRVLSIHTLQSKSFTFFQLTTLLSAYNIPATALQLLKSGLPSTANNPATFRLATVISAASISFTTAPALQFLHAKKGQQI